MKPQRWQRIGEIFSAVVDLDVADRGPALDDLCRGDADLRADVERLLRADRAPSSALDRLEAGMPFADGDPMIGRQLGPYELEARHGEGGMGVVYRARRTDGLFDRCVAIKLVHAGRASPDWIRRFEVERRTLANLDHPSIARLLDAGTSDDGRPYLVMEFVDGRPIDEWWRAETSHRARLGLFVRICRAIQASHNALVVHRDLKPANVLVDADDIPHVVDFGIARTLADTETRDAPATLDGPMTPDYASPEQLTGAPITTAIDVYGLGRLLYELSTGVQPFAHLKGSEAEWIRAVTESLPRRPSTVCAPRIARSLRGDLDRIILEAMHPSPARRYAAAGALADDIERHLRGVPIAARRASWTYVASRVARRHWLPIGALAAALAGLGWGWWWARVSGERAIEEARHAQVEAETSRQLAAFLMDHYLGGAPGPGRSPEESTAALRSQADVIRRQYATSPHECANLLDDLGRAAMRLDDVALAEAMMTEALALRAVTFGSDHVETSRSLQSLGQLYYRMGRFDDGADVLEQGLGIQRRSAGSPHTNVPAFANDLAACLRALGRIDEAESLHQEALESRRRDEPRSLPVAESANNLAAVRMARGDFEASRILLEEALAIRTAILGRPHALSVQVVQNLAVIAWKQDRRDHAIALMHEAEAGYRALGAATRSELGTLLITMSGPLVERGDIEGARRRLAEARELFRGLDEHHPNAQLAAARLEQLDARGR